MRFIEKSLLLQSLDAVWKEHLYALDHLRQGIGLRAYGQRDPLNEYKSEAFVLFNAMLDDLKERVTSMIARVELAPEPPPQPLPMGFGQGMIESHPTPLDSYATEPAMAMELAGGNGTAIAMEPRPMRADGIDANDPSTWRNVGRNAVCPCGSGKKYKHCHGRLA
jgi:preprotein translocase subunit SecA